MPNVRAAITLALATASVAASAEAQPFGYPNLPQPPSAFQFQPPTLPTPPTFLPAPPMVPYIPPSQSAFPMHTTCQRVGAFVECDSN